MSFSSEVKDELIGIVPGHKHCIKSDLAAILYYGEAKSEFINGENRLSFFTENALIAKKVFTFIKKSFNIKPGVCSFKASGSKRFGCGIFIDGPFADVVLKELHLKKNQNGICFRGDMSRMGVCCKRAFLRGAFLMTGSVNDPAKSYHLEFHINGDEYAAALSDSLSELTEDIRTSCRKDSRLIYFKDSQVIADILAAMGAGVSVLNYENARIVNETRGRINRRVNCEVGNLKKSANAGINQINSIRIIEKKMGIDNLPEHLREIAKLRLENPESSLVELGSRLSTPLGKSGVNHRLQKLVEIAGNLNDD